MWLTRFSCGVCISDGPVCDVESGSTGFAQLVFNDLFRNECLFNFALNKRTRILLTVHSTGKKSINFLFLSFAMFVA